MTTLLVFLFTDLEGSTRLWQQYPEAMKNVLARHDDIMRTAVEEAGGQIVKSTGDGVHAVFASAQQGLLACIAAQIRLQQEVWPETGPLHVRMGMHMGEAQERGGDYFGTTVNRAARLMSAAHGDQVLLSAPVAGVLDGHLPEGAALRDLGEHRLKDLLQADHIYQLVHPQLPADFPTLASLSLLPNNLPVQPTVFVGRQIEIKEINERLTSETVRLLTLLGPGGTGKTRLALQSGAELVDHFLDGTYFIDLAPIRKSNDVLTMIARTIGLTQSSNGSMLEDLKDQVREKEMLLLLDNFEQVTSAGVQMAELLRHCPRLKLLTTSREALHVRGEYLYPVRPLGLPKANGHKPDLVELARYEAVQLFIQRAKAVRPDFELTDENAGAIAELCLRLDGLPLAIELATARLSIFSPEALRSRLGNRLKLLRGGARDLPARQQTLRDTIDWSYELLSEAEKSLFKIVSVFTSCTFEAVEAVAGEIDALVESELDVIDGLSSLVNKSLMHLVEDGFSEPRLRMLETIREYATDHLQADPQLQTAVYHAHAAYFAGFAQRQSGRLSGYDRDDILKEMAADVENLKIAWGYWTNAGDLEQLQKMVDALWRLYDGRGWYQDALGLTTDLLQVLSSTASSPEQARQEIMLQTTLARALLAMKGYTFEVEQAYARALQLSEEYGEIPQLFPVLRGLASYYMFRTEFDKSVRMGEKILELAESMDDDQMRMHGYLVVGICTGYLSSAQKALEILEQGIALYNPDRRQAQRFQIGNEPGIVCHMASAFHLWWLGYPDRAHERAAKALELATKLDHPFTKAYILFHNSLMHLWMREYQQALSHALLMGEIASEQDFLLWNALSSILQGAIKTVLGQTEEGVSQMENGLKSYLDHNSPPVFWPDMTGLRAMTYGRAGRPAEGLRLIQELFVEKGTVNVLKLSPMLSLFLGELLLDQSPDEAAAIFKQTLVMAGQMGVNLVALKAATMLCRLELQDGTARESGQTLAELYDWFTEGLETADLLDARAVLDEWEKKNSFR